MESLKERVLAEFVDQLHSIILFGSVARGEATVESDVDLLILIDAPSETRRRIDEITYDIGLENGVFPQVIFFTVREFERIVRMRSWFASDVISQGVVLHDDGTYRRICQEHSQSFAGVPGR